MFFKSLIRRTLAATLKARPRRRATGIRQSLECLESRALLSAVGYETPTEAAEVRVINAQTSAPVENGVAARRATASTLTGHWSITTSLGTITLQTQQHGTHIRGKADLTGLDLSSIAAPLDILASSGSPMQDSKLAHVKFTGTFKNNQLDGQFDVDVSVPGIGKTELTGHVSGVIDLTTRQLNGHVSISVGGGASVGQDFTTPLPAFLPLSVDTAAVPRISGVDGTQVFHSSGLGDGTVTIAQQGLNISGVFDAPNLTTGTFDAHFRTERARLAKGTAELQFTDSQTPEIDQFWISFFRDGTLNRFRYR